MVHSAYLRGFYSAESDTNPYTAGTEEWVDWGIGRGDAMDLPH